ncbi:hypothetical protein EVAR_72247_1 [Eumeta japonica]|uniref:Uncharacterized protein n=1 Tax=Eumeta variegata TaxID=151549 RepID=A0A4C1TER6_EUMVA|nr:hypothetical protein EVAR_72247_1 [Eumeta japonica]
MNINFMLGTVRNIELATSRPYGEAISDKDSIKAERDGHVEPKTMWPREHTGYYGERDVIADLFDYYIPKPFLTKRFVSQIGDGLYGSCIHTYTYGWIQGGDGVYIENLNVRMVITDTAIHFWVLRKTSGLPYNDFCKSCHNEEEKETDTGAGGPSCQVSAGRSLQ